MNSLVQIFDQLKPILSFLVELSIVFVGFTLASWLKLVLKDRSMVIDDNAMYKLEELAEKIVIYFNQTEVWDKKEEQGALTDEDIQSLREESLECFKSIISTELERFLMSKFEDDEDIESYLEVLIENAVVRVKEDGHGSLPEIILDNESEDDEDSI